MKIDGIKKSAFSTTESITPLKDVANYNNYYEFSTDKYNLHRSRKISKRVHGQFRSRDL